MKRYDPFSWNTNGAGWDWDDTCIKECTDGDYVRLEDAEKLATELIRMEKMKDHWRYSAKNYEGELGELQDAVRSFRDVVGRHHTQQAAERLILMLPEANEPQGD